MARTTLRLVSLLLLAGVGCLGLSGCGGGGASADVPGGGRAAPGLTLRLDWGGRQASLPGDAASVTVAVRDAGGFAQSRTLNRPGQGASVETFFIGLAEGEATVTAVAFSGADGQGSPLGTAQATAALRVGQTGSVTLGFASVPLTAVRVGPAAPTVLQGGTVTLSAAGDSALGVVANPPGVWSSANPAVASVNPATGVVTGVAPGQADITFTDATQGLTATTTVRVRGGDAEVTLQ